RRWGDRDLGHDLVRQEDVLAKQTLGRENEELVHRDDPIPFRAGDGYARVQRHQGRCTVGRMDDIGRSTTQYGVILVLTIHGVALCAALLQAEHMLVAIVPATWPLAEVAADRTYIADLRRSDNERRVRESGVARLDALILRDSGQ